MARSYSDRNSIHRMSVNTVMEGNNVPTLRPVASAIGSKSSKVKKENFHT